MELECIILIFECNCAFIYAFTNFQKKWHGCIVAPKTPVYAFTMHPKWLNLNAMLHPRKISRKNLKKYECKSASKSPDYALTMHPNTLFLSATMHSSHNFMIFGGFRAARRPVDVCFATTGAKRRHFPLTGCIFFDLVEQSAYLAVAVRLFELDLSPLEYSMYCRIMERNKNRCFLIKKSKILKFSQKSYSQLYSQVL